MNVVSVRIKYSFWDFNTDVFRVGEKFVYEGLFKINLDISEFEKKIYELIMTDKNDGMTLEVNTFDNIHYVEADLFLGEPGDTYDIEYIIQFLNQFENLEALPATKDLSRYQGFVYIRYSDEADEALDILESCGIKAEKIGMTSYKYELGASDLWVAFILGIASSAAWDTIKSGKIKLENEFNNHYRDVQFGVFNAQKLKENVAHLSGEAKSNLEIISFESVKDEKFLVILNSRYQKFYVEATESGEIIKMKMDRTTQTRI
jgi:hypothetical protein